MRNFIISATPRAGSLASLVRIAGAALAMTLAFSAPCQAQPVQYVKVCSLYGAGWFYIPGTDTCLNANQVTGNQFAMDRAYSRAATGIAMATSLVTPFLPEGTNYAVSGNWGGFDGKNAIGIAGMIRLRGNLVFSVGFAGGLDSGSSVANERRLSDGNIVSKTQTWSEISGLGRAGFQYAW